MDKFSIILVDYQFLAICYALQYHSRLTRTKDFFFVRSRARMVGVVDAGLRGAESIFLMCLLFIDSLGVAFESGQVFHYFSQLSFSCNLLCAAAR